MLTKIENPNELGKRRGLPWQDYRYTDRAPAASLRELPEAVIKTAFDSFSVANLSVCERVEDDSINSSTLKEIQGLRIAMDFPPDSGRIDWCLLTGAVDQTGYVIDLNGDLVQWLCTERFVCYCHASAALFKTEGDAQRAITAAKAKYDAQIEARRLAHPYREAFPSPFDSLKIVPIRVAADELKHSHISVTVAAKRR